MTTNKQELYNKIRTRINELVPRLKDLSFGCEVLLDNQYKKRVIDIDYDENENIKSILSESSQIGMFEKTNPKGLEIIGHPIHLEHILEAIGKNSVDGASFNITDNRIYYKIFTPMTSETGEFDYNLSLSLEDQSLETLEELDKLLN